MVAEFVVTTFALVLLGLELRRVGGAYLVFRGTRVITCPGTGQPAAVDVAAGRPALTAVFRAPIPGLRNCSRWTEHRHCNQECLTQIRVAPGEGLVRTILTKWYEGKSCVCCGRPQAEIHWMQHKPCLMSPDLRIFEWKDIQPEKIPRVLETHGPVRWNCFVAETRTW
jgi:hypothetical protein